MTGQAENTVGTISLATLKAPDSGFVAPLEAIDRTSPNGLNQLNRLAYDIFAAHPDFEDGRNVLGTDEAAREKVLKAAASLGFPPKDTVDHDTYTKLLLAVGQKEALSRRLILDELGAGGIWTKTV